MKINISQVIFFNLSDYGRFTVPLWTITFIISLLFITTGMAADKLTDYKGYKDPALFSRLPNYYLSISSSFKEQQFDSYQFSVTQGRKTIRQRIEGHFTTYCYYFDSTAGAKASPLQIIRNYQKAATKIGGEVLYDNPEQTTLRIIKNNQETWVEVTPSGGGNAYYVRIVEREAMQQQITANADSIKTGLMQNGHAEVTGIFFDFNKADIKPESEPALEEVAKLLKANPNIRVWVVGHTDYVGSADENVTLANARATSVVKALTEKHGIESTRLSPHGVGPYAPAASNASEEGRAKNRRVELVVQPSS
jgi:outer membrane protein OmpA-like peptidoglycan-associated protein